jgi:hypothetical protein
VKWLPQSANRSANKMVLLVPFVKVAGMRALAPEYIATW